MGSPVNEKWTKQQMLSTAFSTQYHYAVLKARRYEIISKLESLPTTQTVEAIQG